MNKKLMTVGGVVLFIGFIMLSIEFRKWEHETAIKKFVKEECLYE